MRETKFRGKALQDLPGAGIKKGAWIYGYYVLCRNHHYVLPFYGNAGFDERWSNWIEVDPETVGPFTGFLDKNKKKIYENDICVAVVLENGVKEIGLVTFYAGSWLIDIDKFYPLSSDSWMKSLNMCRDIIVITNNSDTNINHGYSSLADLNIFNDWCGEFRQKYIGGKTDNPELLKGSG